jgi:hypothetical protein
MTEIMTIEELSDIEKLNPYELELLEIDYRIRVTMDMLQRLLTNISNEKEINERRNCNQI